MKKLLLALLTLAISASLLAAGRQIDVFLSGFNVNGLPLSGGQVWVMDTNGNPVTVYGDRDLTIPLSNPVILDVNGRATIFGNSVYNLAIEDANSASVYTVDSVEYLLNSIANPLPVNQGGTGAQTASIARKNLGVQIGSNVQAWSSQLDSLSTTHLFQQIVIDTSAPQPSITITKNGDITLYGNLYLPGGINISTNLVITGNLQLNNGYYTANPGLINGVNISYNGSNAINISNGYICINGINHYVSGNLVKSSLSGTSGNVYAVYAVKQSNFLIDNASMIETSLTMPVWDSIRQGWYKTGDTNRRCIGFIYFKTTNVLEKFTKSNGIYRYSEEDYHYSIVRNSSTLFTATNLPAINLLFFGRTLIDANSQNNVTDGYLYFAETSLGSASNASFSVGNGAAYGAAPQMGGVFASSNTYLFHSNTASFYYYFWQADGTARGSIAVDGFYWSPDKE